MVDPKNEARSLIRQRKQALLSESRTRALSGAWLDTLSQRPDFISARVVLSFLALPDEVPTQMLLDRFAMEKTFLLPTVEGKDLSLHPYWGDRLLQQGSFGIYEASTPAWQDYSLIEMALIPGVAFDAQGQRLGRGRGYYDRLLKHPHFSKIPLIGLAYRFQQISQVPCEAHDLKMTEVFWV